MLSDVLDGLEENTFVFKFCICTMTAAIFTKKETSQSEGALPKCARDGETVFRNVSVVKTGLFLSGLFNLVNYFLFIFCLKVVIIEGM